MNKNIKRLLLLGVTTAFLATGCSDLSVNKSETASETSSETSVQTIQSTISVKVNGETQIEKVAELEAGTNILDATNNVFETELDGVFLTSIEGYEQSAEDNLWWIFEVNGEMITVGAGEYIIEDGDFVEWELMAF